MDDIIDFFNVINDRFPKSWLKIDDYVDGFLVADINDAFCFQSKYMEEYVVKETPKGTKFTLKNKVTTEEAKNTVWDFDIKLLNYTKVFKDYEKDFFNVESWCSERLEIEINLVRNFLFECSIFKGTYFIKSFFKELSNIDKEMNNLWQKKTNPNWLQKEIVEELKLNLKYLKEVIIEDFSAIYPNFNETLKLDHKNTQVYTSKPLQSTTRIWYKVAQLLANGILSININDYFFNNEYFYSATKLSKSISEYLDNTINAKSIRPYLTETRFASGKDENKNIFIIDRYRELTLIASEAKNNNSLSDYFKKKLEALKLKLSDENKLVLP